MPARPLNTDDFGGEMYNLSISPEGRQLLERVKTFLVEEVEPMESKFFAEGEGRSDRWSFTPLQLELLEATKAKAKSAGLWNFFLPDAESGEGLSNSTTRT